MSPIGAGGMGEVYRARDPRLEREVAVKVLPEHFLEDGDSLARFQAEAEAIASLSHPNIVAIHDTGQEGKQLYVVTELLEGETMRSRLRTRRASCTATSSPRTSSSSTTGASRSWTSASLGRTR